MGSFKWEVDGEVIDIVFSLIRNAYWLNEETKDAMVFEYLDYPDICVMKVDLDVEESEYYRDVWDMLLQVTGLEST